MGALGRARGEGCARAHLRPAAARRGRPGLVCVCVVRV